MIDLKESLKQSAINRKNMIRKFGFIPHSVLEINRGALSNQMYIYQHESPERHTANYDDTNAKHKRLVEAGYVESQTASRRGAGRGNLGSTIMPAELVDFFIKYYSKEGDTYLDPFMGQGIQMQVAHRRGLNYYGYDLSEEFFQYIEAVQHKIDDGTTTIQTTLGDSRFPTEIPDGIGDFSFYSPPYWDIEFYGEEPGQLGYKQTYQDFLQGMEDVARAWLPKFKKGAWHCVNVNDFRKDGRYISYHADIISLFQRAGWELWDTWIVKGLVGGLPKAFAVSFNLRRFAPKFHEYVLIFKRP